MHCTRNGTVQAYNCQLPRSDDGLFLSARATQDTGDAAQVEPTLADITAAQQIIAAGHRAGGHSPALSVVGTVAYDAGYFSQDNCEAGGPDRLIAPGSWTSAGAARRCPRAGSASSRTGSGSAGSPCAACPSPRPSSPWPRPSAT